MLIVHLYVPGTLLGPGDSAIADTETTAVCPSLARGATLIWWPRQTILMRLNLLLEK